MDFRGRQLEAPELCHRYRATPLGSWRTFAVWFVVSVSNQSQDHSPKPALQRQLGPPTTIVLKASMLRHTASIWHCGRLISSGDGSGTIEPEHWIPAD